MSASSSLVIVYLILNSVILVQDSNTIRSVDNRNFAVIIHYACRYVNPCSVKQKFTFVHLTAESKSNCVIPVTNYGLYLSFILHLAFNVCFHILD